MAMQSFDNGLSLSLDTTFSNSIANISTTSHAGSPFDGVNLPGIPTGGETVAIQGLESLAAAVIVVAFIAAGIRKLLNYVFG